MAGREGVIQFDLRFRPAAAERWPMLAQLDGWRRLLLRLGLLGQDPERYGGYGFGNLSHRLPPFGGPPGGRPFVVSGTQTGHLARLGAAHWAVVEGTDLERNRVDARGPVKPSSESLTHAAVYDRDPDLRAVVHGHSPEIWRAAGRLGLPTTAADVGYGTPAMALEVARLFRDSGVAAAGVFAMAGHEDGVIAFGTSIEQAGARLVRCLAAALALGS